MIDLEERLEHPGGRPGGRHELDKAAFAGSLLVLLVEGLDGGRVQPMNPITQGAGPAQLNERGVLPEELELNPHLGFINAEGLHLLAIGFPETDLLHIAQFMNVSILAPAFSWPRYCASCSLTFCCFR